MTQPDLFTSRPVIHTSPTLSAPERKRLSRQNAEILARLQAGPATNRQLSELALNYRARVSELRAAGYDVRVIAHDKVSGRSVYGLVP